MLTATSLDQESIVSLYRHFLSKTLSMMTAYRISYWRAAFDMDLPHHARFPVWKGIALSSLLFPIILSLLQVHLTLHKRATMRHQILGSALAFQFWNSVYAHHSIVSIACSTNQVSVIGTSRTSSSRSISKLILSLNTSVSELPTEYGFKEEPLKCGYKPMNGIAFYITIHVTISAGLTDSDPKTYSANGKQRRGGCAGRSSALWRV